MNDTIKRAIWEKIRAYDRIMLFRHIRMDGDCVGATKGLKALIKATFPEKEVLLIDSQRSDYLAFLGPDDGEAPDEIYRDALAIVLDTATRDRISNQKYALCREIVKIDHHIETDPYGHLNWVEEERSSACEMVADFCAAFRNELTLTAEAATCVFMGMVTDSGQFRVSGVTGDTMRLAGMMLDAGVDTDTLYANLYLQDYGALKFKAYVYERMTRTEHGVACIHVTLEMQRRFSLNFEAASNVITYLENIRGCLCWLAFIDGETPEEGVRVRLRSRFMTVNEIAERHHGGGHAFAAGATVYSEEERDALIREADEAAGAYKAGHENWM
ncbi:MAG: bifunctional oligoribonuclease/PAP phosphatase NrnA [Clostridia bacterium]|nr:bifunctional oligoribonuclease/PAP phosphatase NrnA [Clostridia bacterium]